MSRLDPACEAFVRENHRAYMFVLDAEGAARGWPMTARYADGIFVMTTYRKSPKMRHLVQARRMTLVVAALDDRALDEYVVAEGELRITGIDASNYEAVIRRMRPGEIDANASTSDHYRTRLREGKRALIEIRAESMQLLRLGEGR